MLQRTLLGLLLKLEYALCILYDYIGVAFYGNNNVLDKRGHKCCSFNNTMHASYSQMV